MRTLTFEAVKPEIRVLQVVGYNPQTQEVRLIDIEYTGKYYSTSINFMPLMRAPKIGDKYICLVQGSSAVPIGSYISNYDKNARLDFIPHDARAIVIDRHNYFLMASGFLDVKVGGTQMTMNDETGVVTLHTISFELFGGKYKLKLDGKNGRVEIENSKENNPIKKEKVIIEDGKITIETTDGASYSSAVFERGSTKVEAKTPANKATLEMSASGAKISVALGNNLSINMSGTGIEIKNTLGGQSAIKLLPGGIVQINANMVQINATTGVTITAPVITLPPAIAVGGAPAGGVILPTAFQFDFQAYAVWLKQLMTWLRTHMHKYDGVNVTEPPFTPLPELPF